ncbi:MAG TPA: ATP-binding cassette domain-containing protein, partial [Alicyclobacillus sp.]|nr:ATP-binding cassette domain-containing protein [Alicyclobacillus sp.]
MITMVDVHFCREGFCLAIPGRLTLGRGLTLLVGPNGAGKSTLLEVLSTAAIPDKGEIWYRDWRVIKDLAGIRGTIGYLPADFQPYSHMTPRRFLQYMAVLKGVDPGIEVEERLARTDLVPVCDVRISKLSEGTKRRLGIAQALLGSPEVLLLDEPLT